MLCATWSVAQNSWKCRNTCTLTAHDDDQHQQTLKKLMCCTDSHSQVHWAHKSSHHRCWIRPLALCSLRRQQRLLWASTLLLLKAAFERTLCETVRSCWRKYCIGWCAGQEESERQHRSAEHAGSARCSPQPAGSGRLFKSASIEAGALALAAAFDLVGGLLQDGSGALLERIVGEGVRRRVVAEVVERGHHQAGQLRRDRGWGGHQGWAGRESQLSVSERQRGLVPRSLDVSVPFEHACRTIATSEGSSSWFDLLSSPKRLVRGTSFHYRCARTDNGGARSTLV